MSEQDKKAKAIQWLKKAMVHDSWKVFGPVLEAEEHRATILALLDAPRLPRPEDVPEEVIEEMCLRMGVMDDSGHADMRRAIAALYDHYTAPSKMPYGLITNEGGFIGWFATEADALAARSLESSKLVKLVEEKK